MSRRTRIATPTAASVPSGSVVITRYGVETLASPEMVPEIAHALADGCEVSFALLREDEGSLFVLRPLGCAVQVVSAMGRNLGTFADVARALETGWVGPWWE